MATRLEGIATGAIVLAALMVAGANVHREFFRASRASNSGASIQPTYVGTWNDLLRDELDRAGTFIGDSSAPVKIVEFSDLECPGCRLFHERIKELPQEIRSKVAVIYVHYPLSMHRFAASAARAAECGRAEKKFASVVDALFAKQDSLGLRSWVAFAVDAGVRDTVAFAQCAAASQTPQMVEAGRGLGKRLGVNGTPTIIINGWRFSAPPYDSLPALINRFARSPAKASG